MSYMGISDLEAKIEAKKMQELDELRQAQKSIKPRDYEDNAKCCEMEMPSRPSCGETLMRIAEDYKLSMVGFAQVSVQMNELGMFFRQNEHKMSDGAKAAMYRLIHNQRREV